MNTLWQSKKVTPIPPNQCPYQVSTFYTLWNLRNSPDKILKLMVTMTRSQVKSRSHHDVAHLQPLTNITTKYQLPTPYGFRDIAQTRFYMSRSLRQGQRPNQGHTMTMHTYTLNQGPYQVSTSYTLRFLRYSPDKLFPPAREPIRTPCVKTIPQQLLRSVG